MRFIAIAYNRMGVEVRRTSPFLCKDFAKATAAQLARLGSATVFMLSHHGELVGTVADYSREA
jgi:hypothetical protein